MPRTIVTCDYGDNERAVREDVHRIGRRIPTPPGTEVGMRRGNDHTWAAAQHSGGPSR